MEPKQHYSRNRPDEIEAFISDYRRSNGVSPTIQEIADHCGLSKSTVFTHLKHMEQDGRIITQGGKRGYLTRAPLIEVPEGNAVPIIGRIACGSPILAQENIEDYVKLPEKIFGKGEFYLLRAVGESMIDAGIDDGDLVLIRQQSTADPGQIIVALVNDDEEATLKRYYPEPEKRRIRLHPENETMEDIYVDYCTIQGVAVHILKKIHY